MKKQIRMHCLLLMSIPLSIGIVLSSCASAVMKTDSVRSIHKAALLSVTCNKKIDASESGMSLVTLISEGINADKLQMIGVLEELKKKIYRGSKAIVPFEILSENILFSQKAFIDLNSKKTKSAMVFGETIAAKNYPIINSNDDVVAYLDRTKGVDAVILVNVHYALVKSSFTFGLDRIGINIGKIKVEATMSLTVCDKATKDVVMRNIIIGKSTNSVMQVMGKYDEGKIQDLCIEATNDAYNKYVDWVKKSLQ